MASPGDKPLQAAVGCALLCWLAACGNPAPAAPERGAPGARGAAGVSAPARPVAGAALPPPLDQVPGEVLVKFRPATAGRAQAALHRALGTQVIQTFRTTGVERVRLPEGRSVSEALRALAASPAVEYAEPNYRVRALAIPDDPYFPDQWGLANTGQAGGTPGQDIDAPAAWDLTTGGAEAVVAVIDSGVDFTHPDLAPNLWRNEADCDGDGVDDDGDGFPDDCQGIDVTGADDPVDRYGHGTHVAGIIGAAGNDGRGVAGVAWTTRILSCKFLDGQGQGTVAGAIACLDHLALLKDRGVPIVASNNSWGGGGFSRALAEAVDAQRRRGILFVAAAGNDALDNDRALTYPCSYPSPNVICVGALDGDGGEADFTNYGARTVHLAAPGVDILSTWPAGQGGYAYLSGTSMATPFVTGAVALLAALHPEQDWRARRNLILSTAAPLRSRWTLTGGRLDAFAALTCSHAPLTARLWPIPGEVLVGPGVPVTLMALNVDCAAPAGEVVVAVASGDPVVLRDDGVAPDLAAGDGVYTASWTPPAAGSFDLAFPGDDHLLVRADAQLEPGFPQRTWVYRHHAPIPGLHALVGDLDGAPGLEILATGDAGPLYAWRADGSPVPGWPVSDSLSAAHPALAHLVPGLPGDQVVASWSGFGTIRTGAYRGDGGELAGWPRDDRRDGDARSPVIADLDGDGLDEVLLDHLPDGQGIDVVGAAAVADLFGDGRLEVVVPWGQRPAEPTENYLTVVDAAGTPLPGYPIPGAGGQVAVGDVDGDGEPEIVVLGPGQVGLELRILAVNGLVKRRVPIQGWVFGGVALADLDGDGTPEIVVSTDVSPVVTALRGDGSVLPGWPVSLGNDYELPTEPVVGDVNGDGEPEVVFAVHLFWSIVGGELHVLDRHGVPLPGFPRSLPLGHPFTPALADVDGDGRNEIVVVGDPAPDHSGYYDTLWVFDLGGGPHGPVLWGQHRGNAHHTASVPVAAPSPHPYLPLQLAVTGGGQVSSSEAVLSCMEAGLRYTLCPVGRSCGACSRLLSPGTVVTLTAAPVSDQYLFLGWSGACAGTAPTCTVTMDGARQVGAAFARPQRAMALTFEGAGQGVVLASQNGLAHGGCSGPCTLTFDQGATVQLRATPAEGSTFTAFGGDCAGQPGTTCTLTLDLDRAASARFEARTYPVAVQVSGAGAVVSEPAGLDCSGSCQAPFAWGTALVLRAVPAAHMEFAGWSGDCAAATGPTCALTVTAARQVGAAFRAIRHQLAVGRSGSGGGTVAFSGGSTCSAPCARDFPEATEVTLTASPAAGSTFAGWSGACAGTSPTCTVVMDGDRAVTAAFAALPRLEVVRAGAGAGAVTSSPAGIACGAACAARFPAGGVVTLTAAPAAGSSFGGWSGACSGTDATCQVTLDADASATATFTTSGGGGGEGGGSGGGTGGGGGCTSAPGATPDPGWLLLGLAALLRRRRGGRA